MNNRAPLVCWLLFGLLPALVTAERLDPSTYSQTYIDSVRATMADSTVEFYQIQAFELSSNDMMSIDGHLNEPAWQRAEHRGRLVEKEPHPLIPMSEETEFAILYDQENLYIGVWCWDTEPHKIIRQLNPRDQSSPDQLFLFLDSFHDNRTGYKFNVTPTGVQSDELRYDDVKRDINWNGIWYSAGHIDSLGWYAEIKLPFFNLRFRDAQSHTFGFNIMRNISKDGSRGQWKPHLPEWDNTTRMSQLGDIVNIDNIQTGRRFEIRPYGAGGLSETAVAPQQSSLSTGLDVRFSPSPSVTSDLTLNPDFAQVDADVLEINLTRFPTRFKEMRPFFTERTNIFNTPLELFYSRRIGAKGDILGGAKVTSKAGKGLEFGALACQTGKSFLSTGDKSERMNEKAAFGVFRLKKDIFNSSSIGILYAGKESEKSHNRVWGLDGSFVYNQYLLDLQVAQGSTEQKLNQDKAYYATLIRTGDGVGLSFLANRIEPYFQINKVGYLRKEPFRGINRFSASLRFGPRLNRHGIRRFSVIAEPKVEQDLFTEQYVLEWQKNNPFRSMHRDFPQKMRWSNWSYTQSFILELMNEMTFSGAWQTFEQTELTGPFDGQTWSFLYSTRPLSKGRRFSANIGFDTGTFYNFDEKYVGKSRSFRISGDGRLAYNILSELQVGYTQTRDPRAAVDGRYWQFSSYTTWMFTKDFYCRLHLQGQLGTTYTGQKQTENQYLVSGLISWEYDAGSFFYLAYNEGRTDDIRPLYSQRFAFRDRTLLLKWSYRLNI